MVKIYISNAFSLSMLDRHAQSMPVGHPLELARIPRPCPSPRGFLADWEGKAEFVSVIGHDSTAQLFSKELGIQLAANRVSVKLDSNSLLLVGQYIGPRLPEGAVELPEGARIEWWTV